MIRVGNSPQPLSLLPATPERPTDTAGPAFADLLAQALGEVEQAQQGAAQAGIDLATGRIQDVSQVMIASEQATLTLELFLEVRNKVLEAYQEFMRMSL